MRNFLVLLAFGLAACDGGSTTTETPDVPEEDIGEILATVNGMNVGSFAFQSAAARVSPEDGEALSAEERKEVLQTLIDDKLLYQEALRQGLDKDPKVQKVMVNTLLREEVYGKVRNSDFGDEELRAYYDAHIEDFVVPEKVQVKRILIKAGDKRTDDEALALAEDVRDQLADDPKGSFKEAASEHSEDSYARRGGDVGFVSRDGKPGLDPALVTKAFELDNGELSEVFKTDDGYNILYIANRRERVERTYQQMKGSVLRKVKNQRLEEMYENYVADLQTGATIEIDEAKLTEVEVKTIRRPMLTPGGAGLGPEIGGERGPGLRGLPELAEPGE